MSGQSDAPRLAQPAALPLLLDGVEDAAVGHELRAARPAGREARGDLLRALAGGAGGAAPGADQHRRVLGGEGAAAAEAAIDRRATGPGGAAAPPLVPPVASLPPVPLVPPVPGTYEQKPLLPLSVETQVVLSAAGQRSCRAPSAPRSRPTSQASSIVESADAVRDVGRARAAGQRPGNELLALAAGSDLAGLGGGDGRLISAPSVLQTAETLLPPDTAGSRTGPPGAAARACPGSAGSGHVVGQRLIAARRGGQQDREQQERSHAGPSKQAADQNARARSSGDSQASPATAASKT